MRLVPNYKATMARTRYDDNRLFVRDGFKHFRRSYSVAEVRWGLVTLVLMGVVLGWVIYKGQHPDPGLLSAESALLHKGAGGAAAAADRGPLPAGLAPAGWSEGRVSQFDADTLYVKIDGRADYFTSFGFKRLFFVSLAHGEGDGARSVDIELYDLGSAENALGAYNGERPEGVTPKVIAGGMGHIDRNALLLARGKYYLRAIGSDESEAVKAQLAHLERLFGDKLAGASLPWAYQLFVDRMGLEASQVSYVKENAFSFGFARDVQVGKLAGDAEMFVVAAADQAAATALAKQFGQGFARIGTPIKKVDGASWVRERFIETIVGVTSVERWVVGVRRAKDLASARAALAKLASAVAAMPQALKAKAIPATAAPPTSPPAQPDDGYEE